MGREGERQQYHGEHFRRGDSSHARPGKGPGAPPIAPRWRPRPRGQFGVLRRRHAVADAPADRAGVIDAIAAKWRLEPDAEITLEANPTSVEAGRFRGYLAAGVNRLSIGVQALNDADLKALGRRHTVEEAPAAVRLAASLFPRFSFDLIYGRPAQSEAAWRTELARARPR